MAAREATGARSSSTSVSATSTTGFDASAGSPGAAETFATTPSKGARSSLRARRFQLQPGIVDFLARRDAGREGLPGALVLRGRVRFLRFGLTELGLGLR